MYCPSVHEKCGHSKLKLFRTVELFKGRISHEASHNIEQLHLFIHSAHSTSLPYMQAPGAANMFQYEEKHSRIWNIWLSLSSIWFFLIYCSKYPLPIPSPQHVKNLEARDKSPNLLISVALGSIPHQVLASARDSAKPPVVRNITPTPGAWYRYSPVVLKFTQAFLF